MKKLILFLLLLSNVSLAQPVLSSYELKKFQKQAVEYVYNFEDYVKDIAQTQDKETIALAVHLFDNSAKISVSKNTTSYSVHDYLTTVVPGYKKKYNVVVIDFYATKIDNLKEMHDAKGEVYYEGTFSFIQEFSAKKHVELAPGSELNRIHDWDYHDFTQKTGTVILKKIITIEGEKWILKLGDLTVDYIEILK